MARTLQLEPHESLFPHLYSFVDKGYKYIINTIDATVSIEKMRGEENDICMA